MPASSQFNTDRTHPGQWTVTFSNPPINMFVPSTIVELGALMTGLEADRSVKVVVFQSANPEFFVAHLDVAKAAERPGVLDVWRDFVLRLSSFDREALGAAKAQINRFGMPTAAELQSSNKHHMAFGLGPHSCIGANVVRLEFRGMFERGPTRMPDFRVEEAGLRPSPVPAIVAGYEHVPFVFLPGKKLGGPRVAY